MPDPGGQGLFAGGDGNAGPALGLGLGVEDVPALAEQFLDDRVRRADLLEAQDVHLARLKPLRHALLVGGAEAVDVD